MFIQKLRRKMYFFRIRSLLTSKMRRYSSHNLPERNTATDATVQLKPYKVHLLEDDCGLPTTGTLTRDDALQIYKEMQTVRRLETSAGNLYKEKAVLGFCHLYSGQEAVAVGMKSALRPQDSVITSYRCHAWTYCMGASTFQVLAELIGKKSGVSKGKGGSMHMYGRNFYGGNGIVGAQVPLGAGVALAHQYKNDKGACLSIYGDGAANQGQVFEAYNISKLMKLPCIFICENNGYGMGTSAERSSASTTYYSRGDYIPGIWVDGMDVITVREAMTYALNFCTAGQGPIVIEAATYRYTGHSMSDPGTSYRTRDEIQEVRQTRDPITSFKDILITNNLANEAELKNIDAEVKKQVDEDVKKAKADSPISMEELTADICSNNLEPYIRGLDALQQYQHIRLGEAVNLK